MQTQFQKNFTFFKILLLLSTVALLVKAQTNIVYAEQPVTDDSTGIRWGTDGAWGVATNGIVGGVHVWCGKQASPDVVVHIVRQGEPLILNSSSLYWGATNSFCGPIELQDSEGKKAPLLNPIFSAPVAYPDSFSMSNLINQMPKLNYILMAPLVPGDHGSNFLGNADKPYQLISFNLKDYFKPRNPGEFRLTIWPKIYKRSDESNADHDLYQRVDLAPLTVKIQWDNP